MALTNVTLLSSTQGNASVTGQPVRASGATRSVGSLYTVQIDLAAFQGRVYLEGSLAPQPGQDDWFAIVLNDQELAHLEFIVPTTGAHGYSFKGSYAWIRARVEGTLSGYVDAITLNMGSWAEQPLSTDLSVSTINSVGGNNVGPGLGVYSGKVGQSNVLLNFLSLVEGPGIKLTASSNAITITNTGGGEGSTGGVSKFVDLEDVPGEIVNKGLLIGSAFGDLNYVPTPSANGQVLTHVGNTVVWATPTVTVPTIRVEDEGVFRSNATTIDFVGAGVSVDTTQVGHARVTINGGSGGTGGSSGITETVMLQYTAGSSGTFNSGDVLMSNTDGVTVTMIDPINCLVAFTFSERALPPSSIAIMGQAYTTNEFNYLNVNPAMLTRKVKSGGTSALPALLTNFTGPITLQLRMQDTGATAGAGQRAKLAILFRF